MGVPFVYSDSLGETSLKKAPYIKPPFGYFGSKHRLAKHILPYLPPHNAWVEAFCGSASITLNKHPAPIEVINDIDGEVTNFFQQLRDNSKALFRKIALTPYSHTELKSAQGHPASTDNLERARHFAVCSMMAVNGAHGDAKGGFSYSQSYSRDGKDARVNRWYHLPERLEKVVDRLRKVRIENRDANKIIEMFSNRPASLLYLDPPYLADRAHAYRHEGNNKDFHKGILDRVLKARCMIVISGYENALYSSTLLKSAGWEKNTFDVSTRGTNGKDESRTEVIWRNRLASHACETKTVPITLTKKESDEGKVNPPRS